ncbi:MAG: sugar kinase [Candidatus Krumholzibacteriota bacterium]|nr:sugar kinase [Candidatus Krumholzibacteriota bacterium]
MSGEGPVVCLGHVAIDYLGIVPHLPAKNTKLELERLIVQGGGPAATAAVTLARLGRRVCFVGTVGGDDAGRRTLDELRAESVDVSLVERQPGASSQFAFIMVDRVSADRTILWSRGTLRPLDPRAVDPERVKTARGLLVDSLEPAAALVAVRIAREAGVPVVIDAGTLREGVQALLPFCDHIVASEVFAGQIAPGGTIDDALEAIAAFRPRSAVVTLGERGCATLAEGERFDTPGFAVEAVDTTGAGDVFHGAWLHAVLEGWEARRAAVFSNAVAAMACRELGGRTAIPDAAEAETFIRERGAAPPFRRSPRRR